MTDAVDIDLYADVDHEFAQEDGLYSSGNVDLYDDMLQPSSRPSHSNGMHGASHGNDKLTGGMQFNYQGKKVSIYVGNLTWWTTDQDLQDAISGLGVTDLIEIKFYENRANGQSKGFAVVHLGSESSSRVLMDKLAANELHGQAPIVTPCNRHSLSQFEQQSKAQTGGQSPRKTSPPPQPRPAVSSAPPLSRPAPPTATSLIPANSVVGLPLHTRLALPFPPPTGLHTRPPSITIPPTSIHLGPPALPPQGAPLLARPFMPPRMTLGLPPGLPRPPPGMPFMRGPGGVPFDPRIPPPGRPPIGMPPISPNHLPPGLRPPHLGMPPLAPPPLGLPPPPHIMNPVMPPPAAELPASQPIESYRSSDRSQSPLLSDTEIEEIMNRNRAVSSSAISRAVSDASAGDHGSAIETLVTAISLIKQSKVASDERAKVLIGLLQDCLHGIEEKSYGSSARKRDRSRGREERSRHRESKSRRRDRDRDRDRSRSRDRYEEREFRERSRERDSYSRHDSDRHRR